MKKIFLIVFCIVLAVNSGLCAEKLPLKVTPVNSISSATDELEVGDIIEFKLLNDVYKDNKLLFAKDTVILGYIDFIKENGWCCDNAEIEFKNFDIKNTDGTIKHFKSSLTINGFDMLKYYYPKWKRGFQYIGALIRGKEIDIIPDEKISFNVWYK